MFLKIAELSCSYVAVSQTETQSKYNIRRLLKVEEILQRDLQIAI